MEYKWRGMTYPKIFTNKLVHFLWKRYLCPQEKHLFDEVESGIGGGDIEHYLHCDACGLMVYIDKVEEDDE